MSLEPTKRQFSADTIEYMMVFGRLLNRIQTLVDYREEETDKSVSQLQGLLASSISDLHDAMNSIHSDALAKLKSLLSFLKSIVSSSAAAGGYAYDSLLKLLDRMKVDLVEEVESGELDETAHGILEDIVEQIGHLIPVLKKSGDTILDTINFAESVMTQGDKMPDGHELRQTLAGVVSHVSENLTMVKETVLKRLLVLCQESRIAEQTIDNRGIKQHLADMLVCLEEFASHFDMHIDNIVSLDQRMHENMNVAVQALQVGDIVHQLLAKMIESAKVNKQALGKIPDMADYATPELGVLAMLAYKFEIAHKVSDSMEEDESVLQQNMTEGDSELF